MVDSEHSGTAEDVRQRLQRAGHLHWYHWVAVGLSLLLTLGAWYVAKTQVEENAARQFEREATRAAELITERMQRYEDALWAGVGMYRSKQNQVSAAQWRAFVDAMRTDVKYPGINGLGVIYHVERDQAAAFVARHRQDIPDFRIYPDHDEPELLPITYIEPISINRQARGLDMAHENNRYTAAGQARDTGDAQITGPIVLVQDAGRTPGFLFYAPFYDGESRSSMASRRAHFAGLVYAPFVARKLIAGTLDKVKRHVDIRLSDGDEILYDELVSSDDDFDPRAPFRSRIALPMYGRTWHLDVWSAHSFRDATSSAQPLTILVGGLLIDTLLLVLFMAMARSNRVAVRYADRLTEDLQVKTRNLERSNADLEQFAYVASHDLQEPLRMVGNFTQLLQARYEGKIDDKADQYIHFTVDGVKRMQQLLNELLDYSRLSSAGSRKDLVDLNTVCETALANLRPAIEEAGARVRLDGSLPAVIGDEGQLARVMQNLIGNGIKFRHADRPAEVTVSARTEGDSVHVTISDNGIGNEPKYHDQIFVMFQRLHGQSEYPGTGVGLAICKKVILQQGGDLWVESDDDQGTRFHFTLPGADADA